MPLNEEQTYRDGVRKDIKNLQDVLELRMSTFEKDTRNSLQRIEVQTTTTNGKVRKIIIALVLIFGILIGQTVSSPSEIITLLAHAL